MGASGEESVCLPILDHTLIVRNWQVTLVYSQWALDGCRQITWTIKDRMSGEAHSLPFTIPSSKAACIPSTVYS